jgi:hypothetical protein
MMSEKKNISAEILVRFKNIPNRTLVGERKNKYLTPTLH